MSESDLGIEREKWQASIDLQNKELSIKERELDLRYQEARQSRWSNPLVLAIVGATLAGLGNAAVSYFASKSQRELEESRASNAQKLEQQTAESQRILEMIKTADPDKAAANLEFLAGTNLISNENLRTGIRHYLDTRQKGQGAYLPVGPECAGKPNGAVCGPFPGMACFDGACIFSDRGAGGGATQGQGVGGATPVRPRTNR
jgi:hypothetical protein